MPPQYDTTGDQVEEEKPQSVGVRLVAIAVAVVITAGIFLGWERFSQLGVFGYPAVFLGSLISNATLILPAPGFALVIAAGSTLNPILVGVVGGLGAALGELTGYLAGYGGGIVIQNRPTYQQIERRLKRWGPLAVFVLALVPNPAFDIAGITAGALRMPVWQFLTAAWLGKSLRFIVLAAFGMVVL
jgi:membrane protein YqaA with SNARE-associated domain